MAIADGDEAWSVVGIGLSPGMWILVSANTFTMFESYAYQYPDQTCMSVDDEGFVADCNSPDGWELRGELVWIDDDSAGTLTAKFSDVYGSNPDLPWEVHADGEWSSGAYQDPFSADFSWGESGFLENWPGNYTVQSARLGLGESDLQVGVVSASDSVDYPTGSACFAAHGWSNDDDDVPARATLRADALWELEWIDGCGRGWRDGELVEDCEEGE